MKPKTFVPFFSKRLSFLPLYTTEASRPISTIVQSHHHVELPKERTVEKDESFMNNNDSLVQKLNTSRHEREKTILNKRQKEEVDNLLEQIKEGMDPFGSFQDQPKSHDQKLLILEEYYKTKLNNLERLLTLEKRALKDQNENGKLSIDLYILFRQEIDRLYMKREQELKKSRLEYRKYFNGSISEFWDWKKAELRSEHSWELERLQLKHSQETGLDYLDNKKAK